jgi:hypothetical protein
VLVIGAGLDEERLTHLRLPDQPRVGERIELPDGTHAVVRKIEPPGEDGIDAIVDPELDELARL